MNKYIHQSKLNTDYPRTPYQISQSGESLLLSEKNPGMNWDNVEWMQTQSFLQHVAVQFNNQTHKSIGYVDNTDGTCSENVVAYTVEEMQNNALIALKENTHSVYHINAPLDPVQVNLALGRLSQDEAAAVNAWMIACETVYNSKKTEILASETPYTIDTSVTTITTEVDAIITAPQKTLLQQIKDLFLWSIW